MINDTLIAYYIGPEKSNNQWGGISRGSEFQKDGRPFNTECFFLFKKVFSDLNIPTEYYAYVGAERPDWQSTSVLKEEKPIMETITEEKYLEFKNLWDAKVGTEKNGLVWEKFEAISSDYPPQTTNFPSVRTQLKNLSFSMVEAVEFAIKKGFIIVPQETLDERIAICNGCDRLKNNSRCLECGCNIQFKSRLASSQCPINKWGKVTSCQT